MYMDMDIYIYMCVCEYTHACMSVCTYVCLFVTGKNKWTVSSSIDPEL